jgi:Fic family protein
MDPQKFESFDFGRPVFDGDLGYHWFAPLPLPREMELDTETLLALSRADDALGRLAAVTELVPNPEILRRPYEIKEALASARIEGTQADIEGLLQSERGPLPPSEAIELVQRQLPALETGLQLLAADNTPPTFAVLREVHRVLLEPKSKRVTGRRIDPVWLGSPTDRPETATFVPPVGDALEAGLEDWDSFVQHPPPQPALIRAALLHYQLLTVHPFVDGNGRVGRMMVLLFLVSEGRLPVPLLYLSPYFEQRRREYYDRLQAVREQGEIQEWLQFFLTAIEAQATDGVHRARRLLQLREKYRFDLAAARNRSGAVVDLMFENPVITSASVRDRLEVSTQGALNLIRKLEDRGWLTQIGSSGRGAATIWMAEEIFATTFEEL